MDVPRQWVLIHAATFGVGRALHSRGCQIHVCLSLGASAVICKFAGRSLSILLQWLSAVFLILCCKVFCKSRCLSYTSGQTWSRCHHNSGEALNTTCDAPKNIPKPGRHPHTPVHPYLSPFSCRSPKFLRNLALCLLTFL